MKRRLSIITIALVALCLTSCNISVDEPEPQKQPSIFGRWLVAKRVFQWYTINPETGEEEIYDELIQEREEGVRELWYFYKYDGKNGTLKSDIGPFTTELEPYTYNEWKQQIIINPGDYDEVIFDITNLTLENMTLYAEKWVEEEGFGSKCTIEFKKWWTDD